MKTAGKNAGPAGRGKGETLQQRSALPSVAQSDAVVQSSAYLSGCAPNASPPPHSSSAPAYPIVITFTDQSVKSLLEKKARVDVAVESLNWQRIPMTASTDTFYAIIDLPPGCHNYRFVVNNTTEVVDRSQPLAPRRHAGEATPSPAPPPSTSPASTAMRERSSTSQTSNNTETLSLSAASPSPPADGKAANYILLSGDPHAGNEATRDRRAPPNGADDEGWGQDEIMFEETRKYPPLMPLHLRYTPLNTPPTPFRCSPDGKLVIIDESNEGMTRPSPEHLPLPLSVTMNHVYFQRREDHAVMGMTTRYGNKCSTLVYYTTLESSNASREAGKG